MLTFNRREGTLTGEVTASGIWSGHKNAANDPSREQEHGVGPLPAGTYAIGALRDGEHLGPDVMNLDPLPGTNTFGRSLFRIHGDFAGDTDHSASDGCIIAPRAVRLAINQIADRRLCVV